MSAVICETITFLANHYALPHAQEVASCICPVNNGSSSIRITNTRLTAWTLVVIGSAIRSLCYRQLGRHFTFQLAVREGHTLVTDGPYAVVRHPSYSGYIAWAIGIVTWMWASGSWARECGILTTWWGQAVIGSWTAIALTIASLLFGRSALEDETLSKELREQWLAYAKQTPYKMFPYIY